MKQAYETPIAEKLDFDYTDSVTASGPVMRAMTGGMYSDYTSGCHESVSVLTGTPEGMLNMILGK